MKLIDDLLNGITMYCLVLYILIAFLGIALIFSFFNFLPFNPIQLFFSATILISVCWITNKIFAKVFNAPTNLESVYITALILSLIITPVSSLSQLPYLLIVGILAISSKYIFAINRKHIFNPAAISVVLSSLIFKFGASWWIGNSYMFIPVLIGGLLVVRKLRRFSMVFAFLAVNAVLTGPAIIQTISESAIFFFTFIMLTEPQTTPPTKRLQMFYGGLVGLGSFYLTLETALILGNIFSYLVSPKMKLLLNLKEKIQIAPDIYEFVFGQSKNFSYNAGQYMEWTLPQKKPDSRGSRRYFTLSASPTDGNLRIGVKFYPNGSSFKKSLLNMKKGDQIVASQLSGEFTLPKDFDKKLVFIAGGIGITPFRSMIKYLLDKEEIRDIVLLYSNKTQADIVYKDIFERSKKLGIRVVYVNTDTMGYIDESMIKKEVPDFKDRTFYISGPHSLIDAFEKTLKKIGVREIKVDFFPGYA